MSKYYFNIRIGDNVLPDPEGAEMPDIEAAHAEAIISAQEILAEKVAGGKLVNGQTLEIFDQDGALVAVVPFKKALKLA